MMKGATVIAALAAVLMQSASAQMNCIGQGIPTQAPPICPNHVAECLCNSDGIDCHLVWTCQPWPAPAPQKTTQPAASTPPNQSPLGGLLNGIIEGRRMRQQQEASRATPLTPATVAVAPAVGQSPASAAAKPSETTNGAFNGNLWVVFDPAMRTGFVGGFMAAVNASLSEEDRRRYVGKGTIGDTVRDLDLFYRDTGKRDLPIWLAMHWVNLRAGGTPEDQIPKVLEDEGIWRTVTPEKP